jgi:NADPH-dependent glutamate synthase beta subunit-like oxidoreductase
MRKALGRDVRSRQLRKDFDAVFLGMGLAGVNALQTEGEDMQGVEDAVAISRGCARPRTNPSCRSGAGSW